MNDHANPATPTDTEQENVLTIKDIRMLRPIVFNDKKTSLAVVVQQSEMFKIDGCTISFFTPNNVSLFVSISHRELVAARKIYDCLIAKAVKSKKKLDVKGRNLTRLYNYFEHVQSSIIAIYTALESLANVAIPHDYKLEKKNQKGVTEVWDKEAIERWYKTSDKLSEILPQVLKVESPNTLKVWSKFKLLEEVRNDIIHQKTIAKKAQDVDAAFLRRLLQPSIFEIVRAGFGIISYFCSKDTSHAYFPLGFGPALVKPEEVDDLGSVLTKIDEDD